MRISKEKMAERIKDLSLRRPHISYDRFVYRGNDEYHTFICSSHGEFEQKARVHFRASDETGGCPKCSRELISLKKRQEAELRYPEITKELIAKALVDGRHETIDYSKFEYLGNKQNSVFICKKHGEFTQRPDMHFYRGDDCPRCAHEKRRGAKADMGELQLLLKSKTNGNITLTNPDSYTGSIDPLEFNCKIHGNFISTANTAKQCLKKTATPFICQQCANDEHAKVSSLGTDEFVSRCQKHFRDLLTYEKTNYVNGRTELTVACAKHGDIIEVRPERMLSGVFPCKQCNINSFENAIYNVLLNYVDSDDIIINDRNILNGRELDFYIPSKNLAIECNGVKWHTEAYGGCDRNYHRNKTVMCKEQNIRLVHITNNDWYDNSDLVTSRLASILNTIEHKFNARSLTVREVNSSDARDFLNLYHIQKYCASSIRYGLYEGTKLISLMTFGKSRYNKNIDFELLRFCNMTNSMVRGGASRLFANFVKIHDPSSVISYCDLSWNTGKLYEILGFDFSHTSSPNYRYVSNTNHNKFLNRQKFQKHKLHKLLETFDSDLSEWDNMKNNGYDRYWDCGNAVYHWRK